jgi:hypothetical protein
MADNLTVKDSAAAVKTLRFKDLGAGILAAYHILLDSTGAEVLGEKAKASGIPTNFATDQHLLGRGVSPVSDPFTRPNDVIPYAIGDLVANSTVAGSVVPFQFAGAARFSQGAGRISRCRLIKSTASLTNAQFTVHLFNTSPTVTVGDNAQLNNAGLFACNNAANYIGPIPVTMTTAFSDGATGSGLPGGGAGADEFLFKLTAGTTLYALLEARAAYTPGAQEIFTAKLETEQT